MTSEFIVEKIEVPQLLEKAKSVRATGHRLVQVTATALPDCCELTYSFDLAGKLTNFRINLPLDVKTLPSISTVYGASVLYENEIHDLFGIEVTGMTVDFKGNFYKTATKYPMSTKMTPPKAAPAAAPKAAVAAPAV